MLVGSLFYWFTCMWFFKDPWRAVTFAIKVTKRGRQFILKGCPSEEDIPTHAYIVNVFTSCVFDQRRLQNEEHFVAAVKAWFEAKSIFRVNSAASSVKIKNNAASRIDK